MVQTMTTNEYIRNINKKGWIPFRKKLWQRNYYERIIRNEKELSFYKDYALKNPGMWEKDENNPENLFQNSRDSNF
jgi:hypothetical protein